MNQIGVIIVDGGAEEVGETDVGQRKRMGDDKGDIRGRDFDASNAVGRGRGKMKMTRQGEGRFLKCGLRIGG